MSNLQSVNKENEKEFQKPFTDFICTEEGNLGNVLCDPGDDGHIVPEVLLSGIIKQLLPPVGPGVGLTQDCGPGKV